MARAYIPSSLRELVFDRAAGQCEYCGVHQRDQSIRHTIDHIVPLAHGGETSEQNLALACMHCNRAKGSNLTSLDPSTRRIASLFNPRRQRWNTHFTLEGAVIVGRTPTGRATVKLLRVNDPKRLEERLQLQAIGHYPPK
ncbi:MAG: HNH endonuclease [Anaerolineae bacterium]|nr:HNH endonuclease [Anaerolineae bacterium]